MLIDIATIGAFVVVTSITLLLLRSFLRLSIGHRSASMMLMRSPADRDDDWLVAAARRIPVIRADSDRLQGELGRAGYYQPTSRQDFQILRYSAAALTILVAGFAAVVVGPAQPDFVMRIVILGIVAAILCWALPRLILKTKAQRAAQGSAAH